MRGETTAEKIADRVAALAPSGVEIETVVSTGSLALTRFANSFIHQNVAEEGSTVHIRLAIDGRVASGGTSRTDDDALRALIDRTMAVARLRGVDELWPGVTEPTPIVVGDHFDEATADADPAERAVRVKTFIDAGGGFSAAGFCSTEGHDVAYANSGGHRAFGRTSQATLDGIHQTGTSAGSGHATSIRIGDIDAVAVGELAARRAGDSAAPFDTKPGDYEVVLGPEAVGTITAFLSLYAFGGKTANEGRSMARLGEQQFDESLTLTEDPLDPQAIATPFDGEGSPRKRVALIDHGVTAGLTHDRRSAARAGVETTGSHQYSYPAAGPVASNVFMTPGSESPESMIAAVDRGLYVSTFNYCRVLDEKPLVVTGLTRNGTFMIENGAVTGAVTDLRFTQSFAAALAPGRVLGVGSDARFADSEFGPGGAFVPSLRLASWNFTGGASG